MDWILRVANERNAERHRREAIARTAPALWENICRAIEETIQEYKRLERGLPIESSGPAKYTIWVSVFEEKPQREKGPERERVKITFNQENLTVELSSSRGTTKVFPITLNAAGHACLMEDKKEIPVEKFTELALRDALFPS